jgi:hypothetical protein
MSYFAFHPTGFDLNGAWGRSVLRILDFTVALGALATTGIVHCLKRQHGYAGNVTRSRMSVEPFPAKFRWADTAANTQTLPLTGSLRIFHKDAFEKTCQQVCHLCDIL